MAFPTISPAVAVVLVLLGGGLLGGLANYLIAAGSSETKVGLFAAIVQGVAAAVAVPVLLNMISSGIVQSALDAASVGKGLKPLLELAGFAVVAAVFARKFLGTLGDRILLKAEQADKKAEQAEKKAEEANKKADAASSFVDAALTEPEGLSLAAAADSKAGLSADALKVIGAMTEGRFASRSVSGIAKDTELPRERVNQLLSELITNGLVAQRESSKGPRWYATSEGRAAFQTT